MKNRRLMESLNQTVKTQTTRRYNLAEMISESYRLIYECEEGSNLKKLAESHLADVKDNPREIDRLSRQLCMVKEVARMVEANELKDEDLVDKKEYDEVEPKEERALQTECNECDTPVVVPSKKDEIKESLTESDDPELTDEELEELAKHLETIRKERKEAPKKEEVDEAEEPVAPKRRGIRCTMTASNKPEKEEMSEEIVPVYWTSASFDFKHTGDYKPDWIKDHIDKVMDQMGCEWSGYINFEDITSAYESKKMNEAKEEKTYTIIKDRKGKTSETTGTLAELIDNFSYTLEKGKGYEKEKGNKKIDKNPKTIAALIKNLNNAENNAAKDGYSETSYSLKESKEYAGLENFKKVSESKAFYKTFKKMHDTLKEGKALTRQESIDLYKASNSALTQLSIELEHNPEFLDTFKESVSILSKDVNSLLESLTNGKAPSKNTMKSLAKFSESLLYEADDEDEEEEEITSPFTDDDNEVPEVEETPEEDFVGDDEGDVQSEEADAFDQEYAEERVELHKELVDKHGEDEDPAVQEKIDQDAAEVVNLPGTTEEQIAEINGEAPAEEGEPEDSEEEVPADEEEPTEEPEEDGEITDDELEELKKHLTEMRAAKKLKESQEDMISVTVGETYHGKYLKPEFEEKFGYRKTEIPRSLCNGTVFNQEELVKQGYLKDGESVFYVNESVEDSTDLVSQVKKALDDAGIKYSIRGRKGDQLIVAKGDLEKASEIRNKIDPKYTVTVATPA